MLKYSISKDWPPNIDKIDAVLKVRTIWGVMFAYDHTIYNPTGSNNIPVWQVEHERVHFRQQDDAGGPEPWWDRYLVDVPWRLEQEIQAYQRDYESFLQSGNSRAMSRVYLRSISNILAGRLYGHIIKPHAAKLRILNGFAE